MAVTANAELMDLCEDYGIYMRPEFESFMTPSIKKRIMTGDAALTTTANNGIPLWMLTYHDPQVIDVLTQPLQAERIFSKERRGDWTTKIMQFSLIEHTGGVEPYGDYSQEGQTDVNVNWPVRENYYFQTTCRWGDRQIAEYGKAKVNYHQAKTLAAAKTIRIAHNTIFFYGVEGIRSYGILNDPNLPTPLSPASVPNGWPNGTGNVTLWMDDTNPTNTKTAGQVYDEVVRMYRQASEQSGGLITMDSPVKFVLSPTMMPALARRTEFNTKTVRELLEDSFPNMEFVTVPEYNTAAGQMVQLIFPEVEGVKTGILAYTELERSHGVVRMLSSYKEKKSAGSWGAIIFRPFAIVTLLGV